MTTVALTATGLQTVVESATRVRAPGRDFEPGFPTARRLAAEVIDP